MALFWILYFVFALIWLMIVLFSIKNKEIAEFFEIRQNGDVLMAIVVSIIPAINLAVFLFFVVHVLMHTEYFSQPLHKSVDKTN